MGEGERVSRTTQNTSAVSDLVAIQGLWGYLCGASSWQLCETAATRKPRFDGWPGDQSPTG